MNYTLAAMIASFVGCSFAGKKLPEYEEMFKDVISDKESKSLSEQKMKLRLAEMMAFTTDYNNKRGTHTNDS